MTRTNCRNILSLLAFCGPHLLDQSGPSFLVNTFCPAISASCDVTSYLHHLEPFADHAGAESMAGYGERHPEKRAHGHRTAPKGARPACCVAGSLSGRKSSQHASSGQTDARSGIRPLAIYARSMASDGGAFLNLPRCRL